MNEKTDMLDTWFTELQLVGMQRSQINDATSVAQHEGDLYHFVPQEHDACVFGPSVRGSSSQVVSKILATLKGKVVINEDEDNEVEDMSYKGMN